MGQRWLSFGLGSFVAVAALALAGFCSDQPAAAPLLPCPESSPGSPACTPSKRELKQAKKAFEAGLKLQKSHRMDEALDEFETAARLSPRNVDYLTAKEMTRQQLIFDYLEKGNAALLKSSPVEALGDFRAALHLDPQNAFAQQRLRDALGNHAPKASAPPRVIAESGEVHVSPQDFRADFHYQGDSRSLLTQVAQVFGLEAEFDDSVASRQVRFDITNVDFLTAMRMAGAVTKTFWTPLSKTQVLIASETAENHRLFDRMAMRAFYVPGASTPQELNDLTNLLKNLFEMRFVNPEPQKNTIVVRAPEGVLDAATRFMESLGDARPQVMFDVRVYEVSHTMMRNMGLQIPNQFTMFNIPAGALAALGGQNIQDLINQLISSGGINQANSQALSGLLAQLQNQQNSIFQQPLATFGNGLTLMGVSLGTAGAQLQLNESWVNTLEHAWIRASQGTDANFRVGTRFPILNATFAPIFNTPQIAQVLGNQTFQPAFPSFNYEDLGLTLKAKPQISGSNDVSLTLEMQLRTLTGQSLNGVPVISNREYKGGISLRDGEPAVVAGAISRSEVRTLNGIPGLGSVPLLNKVMVSNGKEEDEDELLLVITPHVISQREQAEATEVWLPK